MNEMKILLLSVLVFLPVLPAAGQPHGGVVTVVPEETDEILANPGMGWETFHRTSKQDKNVPSWIPSTVNYARWGWGELEPQPGKIDDAFLDKILKETHDSGQQLAFRVMCCSPDKNRPYHPRWLKEVGGRELIADHKGVEPLPIPDMDDPIVNVDYVRAWKSSGGNAQNDKPLQPAASSAHPDERAEMTRKFVAQMAAGQFAEAVEPFDKVMKKALPADKLQEVWDGLVKQHGPLERTTETRTEKIQQYRAVYVSCQFQRGLLDAKVVFDSDNKISGLFFVPAGKYKPPAYADFSKFTEEEVSVGKGLLSLPGTLALPKGDGPFPAVVLVHGSGPNDRDETIGPNKLFRDLAHGLASRGIAVLRYEKRTKHHPIMMALAVNRITVKEETVDDAVAACDVLASHEKIDPTRILVLGHSLGGMLIPRIGKAKDGIAGFISLAGSTRPLALKQANPSWLYNCA